MKYKVWHIPQVPGKPFEVFTEDLKEAMLIQDVLANYDLFQLEHMIKPDYSNMSGISYFDEEEKEWWDIDEYELEALNSD